MIYLDNAATTFPKPLGVINEIYNVQRYCGANPGRGGHRLTMKAGTKVFEVREKAGEFFSCKPENVIFTLNCTQSLNTAIKGSIKRGDHVIISCLEHNSVLRPVHRLYQRGLITYDTAPVFPNDEEKTVKSFENLIKSNTSLIVCTHVSNVFGTVLPIEKIGKLCKEKGIRFIVDGAQSAGTFQIDMKRANIDILCMPGHKGLYGPMGTGLMLSGDGVLFESLVEGGTGSASMSENQPDIMPDKFESGTANLPGIAGLGKGLEFIKAFGGERAVHEKEMYLTKILTEDLSEIKGIRIYSEMAGKIKAPVVSFNVEDFHSEAVGAYLDRQNIAVRAGYHCSYLAHSFKETADTGTVRVSVGVFNTKKDIKSLIFFINRFTKAGKMC